MREIDKMNLAHELLNRGYEYQSKGNLEEAIEHYLASIEVYPTANAHTYLGRVYSKKGEYQKAVNECIQAIDLDPDDIGPYSDIGGYLINLNRTDEAIDWLTRAVDSPDFAQKHTAFFNLGKAHETRGDWMEAAGFYGKAITVNSEYEDARKALFRIVALMN